MNSTNFMFDVELIRFRMKCGVEALLSIHDAIAEGVNEGSNYCDAIYGICDYLFSLNENLEKRIAAELEGRGENQ